MSQVVRKIIKSPKAPAAIGLFKDFKVYIYLKKF